MGSMDHLPDDLLVGIFEHLDVKQLALLQTVSKPWNAVSSSIRSLWQCYGDARPHEHPSEQATVMSQHAESASWTLYPWTFSFRTIEALLRRNGGKHFEEIAMKFDLFNTHSASGFLWTTRKVSEWDLRTLWLDLSRSSPTERCDDARFHRQLKEWELDGDQSMEGLGSIKLFAKSVGSMIKASHTITSLRMELFDCSDVQNWFDQHCERPPFKKLHLGFWGAEKFVIQAAQAGLLCECQALTVICPDLFENEAWYILGQAKDHLELASLNVSWSMHSTLQVHAPSSIHFPRLKVLELRSPVHSGEEDYRMDLEKKVFDLGSKTQASDVRRRPRTECPALHHLLVYVTVASTIVEDLFTSSLKSLHLGLFTMPEGYENKKTIFAQLEAFCMVTRHIEKLTGLEELLLDTYRMSEDDQSMPSTHVSQLLEHLADHTSVPLTKLELRTQEPAPPELVFDLVASRYKKDGVNSIQEIRLSDYRASDGFSFMPMGSEMLENMRVYDRIALLVPKFFIDDTDASTMFDGLYESDDDVEDEEDESFDEMSTEYEDTESGNEESNEEATEVGLATCDCE